MLSARRKEGKMGGNLRKRNNNTEDAILEADEAKVRSYLGNAGEVE